MKKYFTPVNIIVVLGFIIHFGISQIYGGQYARYFMCFLILIMIPFAIFNLVKQRREDKLNNTKMFQASIYSMLFIAVILVAFFFITKQDYK